MSPEPSPPRIAIGWLEATLAATGGAFGIVALAQTEAFSTESAVKVAGIPVATAIAAGMLFRMREDRKLPVGLWVVFVLPVVHAALIAAVAALASAQFTGIEKSDELHPALIWSQARILGAAFVFESVAISMTLLVALMLARRSRAKADG